MLDLARQYAEVGQHVQEAIAKVCASQQFVLGEAVKGFEADSANYLGVKDAIGCASGTDAIWLALAAAGIGPGDEVITSSFSFFATASAITRAGAKPVFADVDPETLNLDPMAVERRIRDTFSSRFKGIMPVHLYGQCADMDEFSRIAQTHKFCLVEDAAQAFGSAWRGKRAGGLSHAAAFSFYPTKNLSCYGDGGLVTTNDEKIAERVRLLRNHGSAQRYYHQELGWNSRLDSIQAAVLNVKLGFIDQWNTKRAERATAYDILLKGTGLVGSKGPLSSSSPLRLLGRNNKSSHIFHQYVIRCERRDDLREFLKQRNIGSDVYYPVPIHMQQCFAYLGYGEGSLPETERAAKEVLALPMFPELTRDEQATVVDAIAEFYS